MLNSSLVLFLSNGSKHLFLYHFCFRLGALTCLRKTKTTCTTQVRNVTLFVNRSFENVFSKLTCYEVIFVFRIENLKNKLHSPCRISHVVEIFEADSHFIEFRGGTMKLCIKLNS